MTPLHIVIGCSSLCWSRGGTERAACYLSRAMLERGHHVSLFHRGYVVGKHEPVYSLPPECPIIQGPPPHHEAIVNMRRILRMSNVDVFLSMESGASHLFWAACVLGTGIPFVCSERHHPRHIANVFWNHPGRLAVLSGSDIIHELFPAYTSHVPLIWRDRTRVIGNCAPVGPVPQADPVGGKEKVLLYLARYESPKRPDLLLDAFALLADDFPDWRLEMWGHGTLLPALQARAVKLGLGRRVRIRGETDRSTELYAQAQCYCLPTEEEGFPNTVLEAMSAGLPCVSLSICEGVSELVKHNLNGVLAAETTAESLAEALRPVMASAKRRCSMGEAGRQRAKDYEPTHIFNQWEELLNEAAERKGNTVMDAFLKEPFASRSRLSAAARQEWLLRDFGQPLPYTAAWVDAKIGRGFAAAAAAVQSAWQATMTRLRRCCSILPFIVHAPLSRSPAYAAYVLRQIAVSSFNRIRVSSLRTGELIGYVCERIPVEGLRVLCVGCRDARELDLWRHRKVGEVVGIDLFSTSPDIRVMDMHCMNFPDDSFDIVYSCHSLEHALHPVVAVREMIRVCRNGGYVIIEVPRLCRKTGVDLHSFQLQDVHSFFGKHIHTVVAENLIPTDGNRLDSHRCIYQLQK